MIKGETPDLTIIDDTVLRCMRCNEPVEDWYTCPQCGSVYFCDCHAEPLCGCSDTLINMLRETINDMKQLI